MAIGSFRGALKAGSRPRGEFGVARPGKGGDGDRMGLARYAGAAMQARRLLSLVLIALAFAIPAHAQASRPNVVWITIDDCGPDFGCYGQKIVETPHLDGLAASGQFFNNCYTSTPVCSPARSGLITGNYPTTIGSHQHRSSRPLPDGYQPITKVLRRAGYRVTQLPWQNVKPEQFVSGEGVEAGRFLTVTGRNKLDFNFSRGRERGMFGRWNPAKKDKPFFAMIDFSSPKAPANTAHRVAVLRKREIDPATVELAPYWPDAPTVRNAVARYYEGIELLDLEIGHLLRWLDAEGLRENTLIFVWGDHGRAFLRHKQWCYDAGLRVPLIVSGPGVETGERGDMVSSIDLAATTLTACGVELPSTMEGRDFLTDMGTGRAYVYASRDRCDETEDRVRAVRDSRLKLIHNYHPELPWVGRNAYTAKNFPSVKLLLEAKAAGKLTDAQAIVMADRKPEWELYDTFVDPWEMNNLFDDESFAEEIARLRGALERWVRETDQGYVTPEPLLNIQGPPREKISVARYLEGADPALPRVLLIGDSISMGYTPFVRELLAGRARVHHNPGNAAHTGRGIAKLDEWLGDEHWDVIHFNWGLHDLAYRPRGRKHSGLDLNGEQAWSLEEYGEHLQQLVHRLQATGAKLVWASTTPVPEGAAGRIPGDELKYNEVAARIMKRHEIPIDDLHAHAAARLRDIQQPRNVHFTGAGSLYLAEAVAESVDAALAK